VGNTEMQVQLPPGLGQAWHVWSTLHSSPGLKFSLTPKATSLSLTHYPVIKQGSVSPAQTCFLLSTQYQGKAPSSHLPHQNLQPFPLLSPCGPTSLSRTSPQYLFLYSGHTRQAQATIVFFHGCWQPLPSHTCLSPTSALP
jgi:hypothetical protein